MANKELITCDVAGCSEPFSYRIKGFNLCAKHCFEPGELTVNWIKKPAPPSPSHKESQQ